MRATCMTGFALVVATPVASVLLVITILGLPIGLAMGALYATRFLPPWS